MGWVNDLRGQTVSLGTSPFIFYIEEHATYLKPLDELFAAIENGMLRAVTSTVTLLEVLVHPLRRGDEALAHRYNDILLSSPNILMLPVTYAIAQEAAELRARQGLKTADAIQLATSIRGGATAFITNDLGFPNDCGIKILRLMDVIE